MSKIIILVFLVKIIMMASGKFETFTKVSGYHNESVILSCSVADEPDQFIWYKVSGDKFYEMSSEILNLNLDFLRVDITCEHLQVYGCRFANFEDYGYDVFTVQCHEAGHRAFLKQKMEASKIKMRGKSKNGQAKSIQPKDQLNF